MANTKTDAGMTINPELISLAEVYKNEKYERDEIVSASDFYVENDHSLVAFAGRIAVLFYYQEDNSLIAVETYWRDK